MALRLFNTLRRQVEEFIPFDVQDKNVGMYCCGPTVYDYGHIGNFRTFVFADLVRRYLAFKGFTVNHVMNITDVEDKIIRRIAETKTPLAEFTGRYTDAFLEDLEILKCLRPHQLPRATEFIPQIIDLIVRLEKRGIAYRASDGSVYFGIAAYRACGCQYGQLVQLDPEAQRRTERVSSDEYDKENTSDFALWKARVPEDGSVFWESPWGQGRPGWHIECSAMSMALLGPSFDLHLGGEDLAFPHHEDEIAQSEGAGLQPFGRPFVKHWIHASHLLVEGKKMSKSLGNYYTVRDLVTQGFSGREIRFLLLSAHYRETFNFTLEGLEGARVALNRIDVLLGRLTELAESIPAVPTNCVSKLPLRVAEALDDDLNVSRAWASVFDWVRDTNVALTTGRFQPTDAARELAGWQSIETALGLGRKLAQPTPPEILERVDARTAAKLARDFVKADLIREELKSLGWTVEDTKTGAKPKRL